MGGHTGEPQEAGGSARLQVLTLEDARIIERFYLIEQRHHDGTRQQRREDMTRLAILQIVQALITFERHLPVPLTLGFEHYVKLGEYRARGATYIPYKGAYR
jgi:hypothetical protein